MNRLLTPNKKSKQRRNLKIKVMYQRLIDRGLAVGVCQQKIMKKFDIHSRTTVWLIVNKND